MQLIRPQIIIMCTSRWPSSVLNVRCWTGRQCSDVAGCTDMSLEFSVRPQLFSTWRSGRSHTCMRRGTHGVGGHECGMTRGVGGQAYGVAHMGWGACTRRGTHGVGGHVAWHTWGGGARGVAHMGWGGMRCVKHGVEVHACGVTHGVGVHVV